MRTTHVHKDTKEVLYNIKRHGRHYVSDPRQQTKIRYVGYDENGTVVTLSPTEFRKYVDGIIVGSEWREGGVNVKIKSAEQKTKLTADVVLYYYNKKGPRAGQGWEEETKMRGIVIN